MDSLALWCERIFRHHSAKLPKYCDWTTSTMARASKPGKIHWRAPATIIVAFVAALCFAVGHHFFYKQLDGRSTDSSDHMFDQ
jgi:capsular polysaccharide biosynthesis protein